MSLYVHQLPPTNVHAIECALKQPTIALEPSWQNALETRGEEKPISYTCRRVIKLPLAYAIFYQTLKFHVF